MKLSLEMPVLSALITLAMVVVPSSCDIALLDFHSLNYPTLQQSQVYLMKISQRISASLPILTPEQKLNADAIIQMAKKNFAKCENDYLENTLMSLYRACLGTYTRLAMSQIRALELEIRPTTFYGSSLFLPNTIVTSVTNEKSYSNQNPEEQQQNNMMGMDRMEHNNNNNNNNRNNYEYESKINKVQIDTEQREQQQNHQYQMKTAEPSQTNDKEYFNNML